MFKLVFIAIIALYSTLAWAGPNRPLEFSGSNDLTLSADLSLDTVRTIEAWVHPDACGAGSNVYHTIYSHSNTMIFCEVNRLNIQYGTGLYDTVVTQARDFVPGKWAHVAVTLNPVQRIEDNATQVENFFEVRMYFNGAPQKLGVSRSVLRSGDEYMAYMRQPSSSSSIRLGSKSGGKNWLGAMDEVRFWSVVRSAAEIENGFRTHYWSDSQSGLLAVYTGSDMKDGFARNSTGNTVYDLNVLNLGSLPHQAGKVRGDGWRRGTEYESSFFEMQSEMGIAVARDGGIGLMGIPVSRGLNSLSTGSVFMIRPSTNGTRGYRGNTIVPIGAVATDGMRFGASVAVHEGLIAIGAPSGDGEFPGDQAGAVYVVNALPDGNLEPDAALGPLKIFSPFGQSGGQFGAMVAVNQGRIAVAGPGQIDVCSYSLSTQTCAWDAFADGQSWGPDVISSLDIYDDVLIVGQHHYKHNGVGGAGRVLVFRRTGVTWALETILYPDATQTGEMFGSSVAIFQQRLLVGAPTVDGAGAAYLWDYGTGGWTRTEKFESASMTQFGFGVDVSGDLLAIAGQEAQLHYVEFFRKSSSSGPWARVGEAVNTQVPVEGPSVLFPQRLALDAAQALFGAPDQGALGNATGSVVTLEANYPPYDFDMSSQNDIPENTSGIEAGQLGTWFDVNRYEKITYSIDDAQSPFEVGAGNTIKVKADRWLDFESTPTVDVVVTARDTGGAEFSKTFTFNVMDGPDGPRIETASIPNAIEDQAYSAAISVIDENPDMAGDISLSWEIEPAGDWLVVADGALALQLSGTPVQGDVGTYALEVRATKTFINTTSGETETLTDIRTFDFEVLAENDAPYIIEDTLPDATEDNDYVAVLNAFDEDTPLEQLGFSCDAPAWLSVQPVGFGSVELVGRPEVADIGNVDITCTVSELGPGTDLLSSSKSFTISVLPQNDTPVALDVSGAGDEGGIISVTLQAKDEEISLLQPGESPDWNVVRFEIVEEPSHAVAGSLAIQTNTLSYDHTTKLIEVIATYTHDGSETTADTFRYRFHDGELDSEPAVASINIQSVPDIPYINSGAANGNFNVNEDEPVTISVTVRDDDSAEVTLHLISPPSRGEVYIDPADNGDPRTVEGRVFSVTYVPNRNEPQAEDEVADTFVVEARDDTAGSTGPIASQPFTLDLRILQVNDPPVVRAGLADVVLLAEQEWTSKIYMRFSRHRSPAFYDVEDKLQLGYLAHWQDPVLSGYDGLQGRLPDDRDAGDWLSFNASERSFSALPAATQVGESYLISVVAYDRVGQAAIDASSSANFVPEEGSVIETFQIRINDRPSVVGEIPDLVATQGEEFRHEQVDAVFFDQLTSLLSVRCLSSWLSCFYEDTQGGDPVLVLAGTPENRHVGTELIEVEATDEDGASVSLFFQMRVNNVNDPPFVAHPIRNQCETEQTPFQIDIAAAGQPNAAFGDPDLLIESDDRLSYSTSPLPDGLVFASDILQFQSDGLPVGDIFIEVFAEDRVGETASDEFVLRVLPADHVFSSGTPNPIPPASEYVPPLYTSTEDAHFEESFPAEVFVAEGNDPSLFDFSISGPDWLRLRVDRSEVGGVPKVDLILYGKPAQEDVGADIAFVIEGRVCGQNPVAANAFITVVEVNDPPSSGPGDSEENGLFRKRLFIEQGTPFAHNVQNDFSDEEGEQLSFSTRAVQTNGGIILESDWPAWLSFNAGLPGFESPGAPAESIWSFFEIEVTATDPGGLSAQTIYELTVLPDNEAPVFLVDGWSQIAYQGAEFVFQIPELDYRDPDIDDPAYQDFDPNGALLDELTFSARIHRGGHAYRVDVAEPWLQFDAETRTFHGTPENDDVTSNDPISISITVTDLRGESATRDLLLSVENVNDSPRAALDIATKYAVASTNPDCAAPGFSFVLPENAFVDDDQIHGDTLTYLPATLVNGNALPSWLTFEPDEGALRACPGLSDIGKYPILFRVQDGAGAEAWLTFDLWVVRDLDAPRLVRPVDDIAWLEDVPFEFVYPADAFEGYRASDVLVYEAFSTELGADLPDWLQFDPVSLTFSGLPRNEDVQFWNITVRAKDSTRSGSFTDDLFVIEVKNQNDPPVLDGVVAAKIVQEDESFQFSIAANVFVDPDIGDQLYWQATLTDGTALPHWLNFDPLTRTFSGLPLNEHVGEHQIVLEVRDQAGEAASTSFMLRVQNTNDQPVLMPVGARSSAVSQSISFDVNAMDVDVGDVLEWEVESSDPALVVADIEGRNRSATLRLTPSDDEEGSVEISVVVRDSFGATDEETFIYTATDRNRAPVLNHLPDLEMAQNGQESFAVSFIDPDANDTHQIQVSSTNTDAVEVVGAGTVSGAGFTLQAKNDFVGEVSIHVSVTDDGMPGLRDEQYFRVEVFGENLPPELESIVDVQTDEETPVAFTVNYSDPNPRDTHTIRLQYDTAALDHVGVGNQSGSVFWLSPRADFVGQTTVDVHVQETGANGLSDHTQFVVTVSNDNDAPVLAPLSDLATSQGEPLSFTVDFVDVDDSAGHFLTVESSDSDLIVVGSGQASGSAFDLVPQPAFLGRVQVRVSVQDPAGASDNENFWVTVSNELSAPVIGNIADIEMNEDESFDILVPFTDANEEQSHEVFVSVSGVSVAVSGDANDSPALRTLVPDANIHGNGTVHIRVVDEVGLSDEKVVNLVILPQNDVPVMAPSAWETQEENPVSGQVTAADADGDELVFELVSGPQNGTLSSWDENTGTFEYVPALDFYGVDSFEVLAKDASSSSAPASISISVSNVNEEPTLQGDGFTTEEDVAYSGAFVANDSDGRVVSILVSRPPANGTLRITDPAAGQFQYVPVSNRNGTDSFDVRALDDGGGLSPVLSVDVVISPVNDAPYFVAPTPFNEIVAELGRADLNFELRALDVDSPQLEYRLEGLPPGAVFNPGTRAFSWPVGLQRLGAFAMVAFVGDGGLEAQVPISILIQPAPDTDTDQDGVPDLIEIEHGLNPDSPDTDGDNIRDGDEYAGGIATPADTDNDGIIDALDTDSDGDGHLDQDEAGDQDLNTPPVDTDDDGTGDWRDTDSDEDGVLDETDNCALVENPNQEDSDGDEIGDACDTDTVGNEDAGVVDGGIDDWEDASVPDDSGYSGTDGGYSSADAGLQDGGEQGDGGYGLRDAGIGADASSRDASVLTDAGDQDGGPGADAGAPPGVAVGCGCSADQSPAGDFVWFLSLSMGLGLWRRSRRRER